MTGGRSFTDEATQTPKLKAILGITNAVTHKDQDKEDIERGLIQRHKKKQDGVL